MAAWFEDGETYDAENERVRAWNMERLVNDCGVPPVLAADAAQSGVDWHDVERIVRLGCPAERALEIVA